MSKKEEKIFKEEEAAERRGKRNSAPPDNHGDNYVTGQEKIRTQGKGDSYRVMKGWYSKEVTEKFNRIFKKRQKQYNQNVDHTEKLDFDEGSGTIPPEFEDE